MHVLAALKHKGSEPERIPLAAAVKNFTPREPVADGVLISAADSAVKAVVFAVIRKFDKSADVYLIAVIFAPHLIGNFAQLGIVLIGFDKRAELVGVQNAVFAQKLQAVHSAVHRPFIAY